MADKLAQDYIARGGDSQWNYKPDKFNLIDWLFGRKFAPSKPLTLYGVDKTARGDITKFFDTTLNYGPMKKYNPYVAEQYKKGLISDREAQSIINNGNYPAGVAQDQKLEQENQQRREGADNYKRMQEEARKKLNL